MKHNKHYLIIRSFTEFLQQQGLWVRTTKKSKNITEVMSLNPKTKKVEKTVFDRLTKTAIVYKVLKTKEVEKDRYTYEQLLTRGV